MAMNYEIERHIEAAQDSGNIRGVEFLRAQQAAFNVAREAGIVEELPLGAIDRRKQVKPEQVAQEPALSLEQDSEKFVLSASFDSKDYVKNPTCQNCGKEYKPLRRYSRVKSSGNQVKLELLDYRETHSKAETILLSREELEKRGAKLDDFMFPFTNPEVFKMVFGHENPEVVYGRLKRYLSSRFTHPWAHGEGCKQYISQSLPSFSSFLLPIFETMQQSGFSLRRIAEAFSASPGFHTTIRRALKREHSGTKPVVLPINPKRAKFEWNGIQLSSAGRVISELKIVA